MKYGMFASESRASWMVASLVLAVAAQAALGQQENRGVVCQGTGLVSFGPLNVHGFPTLYTDSTGLSLEHCNDPNDPFCLLDPALELPFPNEPIDVTQCPSCAPGEGNYFGETFYHLVVARGTTAGGLTRLVNAIEGVFGGPVNAVIDGEQTVFSRLRIRVDVVNDPSSIGIYTVTHPYGVDVFEVTADVLAATLGIRAINATYDCFQNAIATCGPGVGNFFGTPLDSAESRINPFLTWDPPSSAPLGYVGDPAFEHIVTGSPCGTNFYRIEGPNIGGPGVHMIETDLFTVLGKIGCDACNDGLFCNGEEVCVSGVCQAGSPACPNTCEHCRETTNDCAWCIFDHNTNGVTDGLDYGFFSGCFGSCHAAGDPCAVANYDQDPGGCVGGADFGALSGCFGLACADCALCAGPAGGGLGLSTTAEPTVALQVVALATPSGDDFAETLPLSSNAFHLRDTVYLEMWASLASGAGDGLASVYADLTYDHTLLTLQETSPSAVFENLARVDLHGSVGGCAPLGDSTIGLDSAWVRVATLKMKARSIGDAAVVLRPSEQPFDVSFFGRFGGVDASRITFGGAAFQLKGAADSAEPETSRKHGGVRARSRDGVRLIEK